MATALLLHIVSATLSLPLGAYVLFRKAAPHRLAGRIWAVLMAVAAVTSFFIASPGIPHWAGIGPIHALSAFTLFSLGMGVLAIRRGDRNAHRRWMTGPYV